MADRDETPTEDRGYTEAEQGESRTTNPTAPASSGRPHGGEGTVDPTHGSDLRPRDSQAPRRQRVPDELESTHEETPVRSPSGGADAGGRSGTGSAGAASVDAGSDTPGRAEGELEKHERRRDEAEEEGGGRD